MKHLIILFATFATMLLSFTSCKEDEPVYMQWEITNSAGDRISVQDAPGYHPQVRILAKERGGEITLKCKNFSKIYLDGDSHVNAESGVSVIKSADNSITIVLDDMESIGDDMTDLISVSAKDGKTDIYCQIAVIREPTAATGK